LGVDWRRFDGDDPLLIRDGSLVLSWNSCKSGKLTVAQDNGFDGNTTGFRESEDIVI
jgi:hypothetical protein